MNEEMCSVCGEDAEYKLGCEICELATVGYKDQKTVYGWYCVKCLPGALERFVNKAKDMAELI